jgi:DNA-binding response OmpR family regulator
MNRPASWRSMMDSVVDRRPFRVGGATVDPISRDASWNGGEERLQPQTLKVLLTLVSRRGEVVTRDELIQLCWDGALSATTSSTARSCSFASSPSAPAGSKSKPCRGLGIGWSRQGRAA